MSELDCWLWGCEAWANSPAAPIPLVPLFSLFLLIVIVLVLIWLYDARTNKKRELISNGKNE